MHIHRLEVYAEFECAVEVFCNILKSKVASSTISKERDLETSKIHGLSAVQIVCLLTSASSFEVLI